MEPLDFGQGQPALGLLGVELSQGALGHEAVDGQKPRFVLAGGRLGRESDADCSQDAAQEGSHVRLAETGRMVYDTVFNVPAGLTSPFFSNTTCSGCRDSKLAETFILIPGRTGRQRSGKSEVK